MNYLTAIIITEAQPTNGATALKYHNIPETGKDYDSFIAFAAKFPGVKCINFYYKRKKHETKGRFKEKIYMQ